MTRNEVPSEAYLRSLEQIVDEQDAKNAQTGESGVSRPCDEVRYLVRQIRHLKKKAGVSG